MPFNQRLALAEMAVNYTQQTMTYGASNKNIDMVHNITRRTIPPCTVPEFRNWREQFYPGYVQFAVDPRSNVPLCYLHADGAELSGMGNCGEQAALAFDYITRQKAETGVALYCLYPYDATVDFGHTFVVLGLPREPVRQAIYSETYYPAGWETAVLCDPWAEDWFEVRGNWPTRIRRILETTDNYDQAKTRPIWLVCMAYFDDNWTPGTLV